MLVLGGRSGRPRGGARQPSASRPPPCRKMPAQDEDLKTDQSSAKPQKSISEFLDLLRSRRDLPLAQTKDRDSHRRRPGIRIRPIPRGHGRNALTTPVPMGASSSPATATQNSAQPRTTAQNNTRTPCWPGSLAQARRGPKRRRLRTHRGPVQSSAKKTEQSQRQVERTCQNTGRSATSARWKAKASAWCTSSARPRRLGVGVASSWASRCSTRSERMTELFLARATLPAGTGTA